MYFIFGKFGNRVSRYYVIPKKLVDNSRYLQGLSESAEISVDYVCSEAECRHILQAIVREQKKRTEQISFSLFLCPFR